MTEKENIQCAETERSDTEQIVAAREAAQIGTAKGAADTAATNAAAESSAENTSAENTTNDTSSENTAADTAAYSDPEKLAEDIPAEELDAKINSIGIDSGDEDDETVLDTIDTIEEKKDEALELAEEGKYTELKELLEDLEPADIAQIISEAPRDRIPLIFRVLPKDLAAESFTFMDGDEEELLINAFSDTELENVMSGMFLDDTVDLIEEMPANVVRRLLQKIPPEKRRQINEIMNYPDDSAGSIMTIEYIDLTEGMTVGDALKRIRRTGLKKETVYTCYVLDMNRKLQGVVTALDLMTSESEDVMITDIMDTAVICATTHTDKEDVGKLIEKYDLLAVPIVDKENRLVGIVTVDDAIDVIQEEAEEDFAKMNAMAPIEKPYLKTGVFEIWRSRIGWLMLLMISATFTGMIISSFEDALAVQVTLTAFIPMLMDSGGNSGSQASVTIIRALSTGEVEFGDILRVMWKELRVSVLCGFSLAAATFVKILLVDNLIMGKAVTVPVALVVCITLCCTIIIAKLIGCTLPMFAEKIGFDPAVMASPFITTIVDAVSLLIYFTVAKSILSI